MAHVAMGSLIVTGGVAGADFVEGSPVVISASGLHDDLPTVTVAPNGARNIFIALIPPDNFPRPTPMGMFRRPGTATSLNSISGMTGVNGGYNVDNAAEYVIDSGQRGPQYLLGPSMMQEPTVYSGFMVQLHRGGAYTLTASNFTDSAEIRVPGNTVAVTGGKFVYSASNVVGTVREYRDGRLTIVIDSRSA